MSQAYAVVLLIKSWKLETFEVIILWNLSRFFVFSSPLSFVLWRMTWALRVTIDTLCQQAQTDSRCTSGFVCVCCISHQLPTLVQCDSCYRLYLAANECLSLIIDAVCFLWLPQCLSFVVIDFVMTLIFLLTLLDEVMWWTHGKLSKGNRRLCKSNRRTAVKSCDYGFCWLNTLRKAAPQSLGLDGFICK